MAHRTNVIQVHKDFPSGADSEMTVDPQCGKKMPRKEAKSILFQEGATIYFCSRECLEKYRVTQLKSLSRAG